MDSGPESDGAGSDRAPLAATIALAITVAVAFWALAVAITGGFTAQVGPLRISSHRALPVLLATLVLAFVAHRLAGTTIDRAWLALASLTRSAAPAAATLLSVMVVLGAARLGSRVAAGSDAYGYISQAELWARGRVVQTDTLAAEMASRLPATVFAPLGYTEGRRPGSIVPTYPPGLPLIMAGASRLFGHDGIFIVVPLCAGVVIALTYALGSLLGGRLTGLASAALLATSPAFVYLALQPMSDVPATAFWATALLFALTARGRWPVLASGLCAGVALLVRPSLLPLAGAIALLVWLPPGHGRIRRLGAFVVGLIPGAVALGAIQWSLYGSPLRSGYGSLGALFALHHVLPNTMTYARWLLDTQGPMIFLVALTPVAWRHTPARASSGAPIALVPLLAFLGLLGCIYLLYLPFDSWSYLRFLLPGLPLALVLSVVALRAVLARVAGVVRRPVLLAAVGMSVAWGLGAVSRHGVMGVAEAEERHVTVARYVADALPPEAVYLAVQHSGSLRYYSGRGTLRFDYVEPDRLDKLPDRIANRGHRLYFVLEDWEEPIFRARFAKASPLGTLDWPPMAELRSSGLVRVYDPAGRARHLTGVEVETVTIH